MQHTLETLKTYVVKCTYLGVTAEITDVAHDDIADAFQTLDTEFGVHSIEAFNGVWKWTGSNVQTGGGTYTTFDSWLNWRAEQADETGICSEGLNATGRDAETFDSVNALLEAASEPLLVLVSEEGEVVTDRADADWALTFDTDYANKDALVMLDSATWAWEESGEYDEAKLLELVKESGSVEFDQFEGDNAEILDHVKEVAERNGYTLAVWRGDDDTYEGDFEEPRRANPATDEIQDAMGVETFAVFFETRDRRDQCEASTLIFVRDADVESAVAAWNKSDIVFYARLEEEFQNAEVVELETQEELAEFVEGAGKFDDEEGWGYVECDGTTYCKARSNTDDEPTMYERDDHKETWSQA